MSPIEDSPSALITGASGGFGWLTALELAANGWQVAAGYRDPAKRNRMLEQAARSGLAGRIVPVELDVTDEGAAVRTAAEVVRRFGDLRLLVNNAGLAVGGFTEDVPLSEWRKQMETNFFGLVGVTRAVVPYMRRQGYGTIINVSSISGRMGIPGFGPYAASKFAVEGFSEALRMELLPCGVKVVLVEPGSFKTDIWQKGFDRLMALGGDSPYKERLEKLLSYTRRTAEGAEDPVRVAQRIAAIAALKHPKLRYPIGRGVRFSLAARAVLPWKLFERLIGRMLR